VNNTGDDLSDGHYNVTCTIQVPETYGKYTYYCRLYDGIFYSKIFNTTFYSSTGVAGVYNVTSEANATLVLRGVSKVKFYVNVTFDGTPQSNVNVTWIDETDGVTIGSNLTNSSGVATLVYTFPSTASAGNHTINVTAKGVTVGPCGGYGYNDTLQISVATLPTIISTSVSPTSGDYEQPFNFSITLVDEDGDTLNITLLISSDGSTWNAVNSTLIAASSPTTVSFLRNFLCSDIGTKYFKFGVEDRFGTVYSAQKSFIIRCPDVSVEIRLEFNNSKYTQVVAAGNTQSGIYCQNNLTQLYVCVENSTSNIAYGIVFIGNEFYYATLDNTSASYIIGLSQSRDYNKFAIPGIHRNCSFIESKLRQDPDLSTAFVPFTNTTNYVVIELAYPGVEFNVTEEIIGKDLELVLEKQVVGNTTQKVVRKR